ncbi:11085_t:CDS:2 [Ambispora leptoticha]|uniref:11085_t:CDS:1 n=1 Tax=Ambispora leptoticha TaxID=144679 RepID=A0A9N9BA09_9GLOM|nr:11085_t:CDS:2 [Ambispora leptoticha]
MGRLYLHFMRLTQRLSTQLRFIPIFTIEASIWSLGTIETVNSQMNYCYLDSNPFRDGKDTTTNITLARKRLGEEGLHVYTLGKHQIGLYYYARTIRKALKYPILAALGFELQYVDRPRLDTMWSSRAKNMSTVINPDYFGNIQLLGALGLLGGFWSALKGFYDYLFGTDQQQGAIHAWLFRNQEPTYDNISNFEE